MKELDLDSFVEVEELALVELDLLWHFWFVLLEIVVILLLLMFFVFIITPISLKLYQ